MKKLQQLLKDDSAQGMLEYVLLLAIPGVNIVTVADASAELGPIPFYLNANAITGRAGLMPSRYQSDQVVDEFRWPTLAPGGSITSFGEDAAGELYITSADGRVFRVVPK